MWFVYFVVAIGIVLASLTLGAATFFERTASTAKTATSPLAALPLPRPKPKVAAADNYVEDNTVREPKTVSNSRKERRTKVSRHERW
jgi:hypothetical protein